MLVALVTLVTLVALVLVEFTDTSPFRSSNTLTLEKLLLLSVAFIPNVEFFMSPDCPEVTMAVTFPVAFCDMLPVELPDELLAIPSWIELAVTLDVVFVRVAFDWTFSEIVSFTPNVAFDMLVAFVMLVASASSASTVATAELEFKEVIVFGSSSPLAACLLVSCDTGLVALTLSVELLPVALFIFSMSCVIRSIVGEVDGEPVGALVGAADGPADGASVRTEAEASMSVEMMSAVVSARCAVALVLMLAMGRVAFLHSGGIVGAAVGKFVGAIDGDSVGAFVGY